MHPANAGGRRVVRARWSACLWDLVKGDPKMGLGPLACTHIITEYAKVVNEQSIPGKGNSTSPARYMEKIKFENHSQIA